MLSKTSESAIQTLIYLALHKSSKPVPPRQIAQFLDLSASYLAKVTSLLVKANILRAHRGALGGVTLGRPPEAITLLQVFEACQGQVVGNYCQEVVTPQTVCPFHQAMSEVHQAMVSVLSKWTLADLALTPECLADPNNPVPCYMAKVYSTESQP